MEITNRIARLRNFAWTTEPPPIGTKVQVIKIYKPDAYFRGQKSFKDQTALVKKDEEYEDKDTLAFHFSEKFSVRTNFSDWLIVPRAGHRRLQAAEECAPPSLVGSARLR